MIYEKLLTIILLFFSSLLVAQNLHYSSINLGHKHESYKVSGNNEMSALFHFGAGASMYLVKHFIVNLYAEEGLLKNDYLAKFDMITMGSGNVEYRWFNRYLYSTFGSIQMVLNFRVEATLFQKR